MKRTLILILTIFGWNCEPSLDDFAKSTNSYYCGELYSLGNHVSLEILEKRFKYYPDLDAYYTQSYLCDLGPVFFLGNDAIEDNLIPILQVGIRIDSTLAITELHTFSLRTDKWRPTFDIWTMKDKIEKIFPEYEFNRTPNYGYTWSGKEYELVLWEEVVSSDYVRHNIKVRSK